MTLNAGDPPASSPKRRRVDVIELGGSSAVQALVGWILDPERSVAVAVASTVRGRQAPAFDLCAVREVLGEAVAIYVLLPGKPTRLLAELLPAGWEVRNGALRVYQPVPVLSSREHPLIVDDNQEYGGKALERLRAEWMRTKTVPTRERVECLEGERRALSRQIETLTERLAVVAESDPVALSLKTDPASRLHRLICEEWIQATSEPARRARPLNYRLSPRIVHDFQRRRGVTVTSREIAAVMATVASGRVGALDKPRLLDDAKQSLRSAATAWECELGGRAAQARLRFTTHPTDGIIFDSIAWEPSTPSAEAEHQR